MLIGTQSKSEDVVEWSLDDAVSASLAALRGESARDASEAVLRAAAVKSLLDDGDAVVLGADAAKWIAERRNAAVYRKLGMVVLWDYDWRSAGKIAKGETPVFLYLPSEKGRRLAWGIAEAFQSGGRDAVIEICSPPAADWWLDGDCDTMIWASCVLALTASVTTERSEALNRAAFGLALN